MSANAEPMRALRHFRVGASWATEVEYRPVVRDQEATLAVWFIHAPGLSIAWSEFVLSLVHLRPIEGVRPAFLSYPEAEYELMVMALDPQPKPVPGDVSTWHFLRPVNVVVQFHGCSDAEAKEIACGCANAALTGYLALEPDGIAGAREQWHASIVATVDHYRGKHPDGDVPTETVDA
jgi:hypothetical protein